MIIERKDFNNAEATGKYKDDKEVDDITISWNPLLGLKTQDVKPMIINEDITGAMTPATLLLHEAGHAERFMNVDTKEEMKELRADNKRPVVDAEIWTNNEEKRTILNIEIPYIEAVNKNQPFNILTTSQQQTIRMNHYGITYKTAGVNSITPADGTTVPGQVKPSAFAKKMIMPTENTRVDKSPSKPIIIKQ